MRALWLQLGGRGMPAAAAQGGGNSAPRLHACRARAHAHGAMPPHAHPLTRPTLPRAAFLCRRRYVVAETSDALIVAFLGTKHAADHAVNLRLRHAPVFTARGAASPGSPSAAGDSAAPAAHSGYLRRAEGVPAEQLYRLARVRGRRLVLAGAPRGLVSSAALLAGS